MPDKLLETHFQWNQFTNGNGKLMIYRLMIYRNTNMTNGSNFYMHSLPANIDISAVLSKIENVPTGIKCEKSSKDAASSGNLVSTIGAKASPKNGGRNQLSRRVRVPRWHATPVANAS